MTTGIDLNGGIDDVRTPDSQGASVTDVAEESDAGAIPGDGTSHEAGDAPGTTTSRDAGAEPEWGATTGRFDSNAPAVGPAFDAVARAREAVAEVSRLLDGASPDLADMPQLACEVFELGTAVQAAHVAIVGTIERAQALPPGPGTARAWLVDSHRMAGSAASRIVLAARWLDQHPLVAQAFEGGTILFDHVDVMRKVSQRTPARREAFVDYEALLTEAAGHAGVDRFSQVMAQWAEVVDSQSADDDADEAHGRREFFLSPVADGWDVRGWLPAVMGAELAGILAEYVERARRAQADVDEAGERATAAAIRADALMDMARAAAASDLSSGAKDRAKVVVTIPVAVLHTCRSCGGHHHGAGEPCDGPGSGLWQGTAAGAGTGLSPVVGGDGAALDVAAFLVAMEQATATWATGNGPGGGILAPCEAAWLTCDGEVTRLVTGSESRPLDVGRATRAIPPWIRTALVRRDGGCVVPGCDLPAGWCEAHHVQHWSAGGLTSTENLALLCSRHHKELHLGHWRITMAGGLPHVTHISGWVRRE